MANMRRRTPEPPPGPPQVRFTPGLADETLRELAPLLAEEGIDVDDIDVPDLATLQAALDRAVERHNMARFTPVGPARDHAVGTLRLVLEAITDTDTNRAADILDQVPPESPDNTAATVAGCIGLPSACSTTGCPATTGKHRPTSVSRFNCRAGTGAVNGPRPTSWSWPAKGARFARWTPSSPGRAVSRFSTAAPSRSPPPSKPGHTRPEPPYLS